ncbi:MAG: hypothetical protein AAGF92_21945 [Myxococcota bacterium]
MPTRVLVTCAALFFLGLPRAALADEAVGVRNAPEGSRDRFAIGIEVGLVIPVADKPLCPSGSECLFGAGLAVGIPFSYRWKQGTGLGFSYELWVQNSDGVYQSTVSQAFAVLLRHSFLADRSLRPLLRARGGVLILGPTFGVDTVGGTAEIAFGGETDINRSTVFSFLLGGQVLSTRPFTTSADGVRRAEGGGVNAALVFRVGIAYLL